MPGRRGKTVIDLRNGNRYSSIPEAAKGLFISSSAILNKLKRTGENEIEVCGIPLRVQDESPYKGAEVYCLETQEVFKNSIEAAKKIGVSHQWFYDKLNTGKPLRGLHYGRIKK